MQSLQQKQEMDLEDAKRIFNQFIEGIEKSRISQMAIRKGLKKYEAKNMKVNNLTPLRVTRIYQTIIEKYQIGVQAENNWLENERRIFVWILMCYLHKEEIQISQMNQQNFDELHRIFPRKGIQLIKFQANSLIKNGNRTQNWKFQEDETLKNIMEKHIELSDQIQWSLISKQFFTVTDQKYFRSSKQCRERWLNHLDPNKIKGGWIQSDDIMILKEVLEIGKKWSKISILFQGKKNQHMVKNRYKSLINKFEKKTKHRNVKEDQLIQMLLTQLNNKPQPIGNQPAQFKQRDQDSKMRDSQLVDISQLSEKSQKQFSQQIMITEKIKNVDQKNFQHKNQETYRQVSKPSRSIIRPIIIEHPSDYVRSKTPLIPEPKSFSKIQEIQANHHENEQFEGRREAPEIVNQIEFYGNDNNNDMFDRIFQNVNTPSVDGGGNRLSSLLLAPKSPFIMSPFQPGGWTPSIFLFEDQQGQMSPQLGFGNFCSKFASDFDKFIGTEQNSEKQK